MQVGSPLTHQRYLNKHKGSKGLVGLRNFVVQCEMDVHIDIKLTTYCMQVGSPLTHQRYLNKHKGTYGPAISAANSTFPGCKTPLPGLYRCAFNMPDDLSALRSESCADAPAVPEQAQGHLRPRHQRSQQHLSRLQDTPAWLLQVCALKMMW